jgi:hypothetical protein
MTIKTIIELQAKAGQQANGLSWFRNVYILQIHTFEFTSRKI